MKDFSLLKKKFALFIVVLALASSLKQSQAQCVDNFEPNDVRKQAAEILTNEEYHALINTNFDVDWFKFTVSPDEPNVMILLFDQTENYNLFLFDSTKAKIAISKKKKLEPDTIVMNGLDAGKFAVKIRAKAGRFDPNNCYSLIVNSSSTPYRQSVTNDLVNDDTEFELYPNPATDKLIVQFDEEISSLNFSIYNLMGQKISEIQEAQANENGSAVIDVSTLNSGEYFLKISYDGGMEVKKFIVSK